MATKSRDKKNKKLVKEAAKKPEKTLLKLDLACGQNKTPGYTGVDIAKVEGVDIVHDLLSFPWPFKDGSVETIISNHFFEHVPGPLRGKFMNEVWRVLVEDGTATFVTPFYLSVRAQQDYTHAWPGISEYTYQYFNKAWREANKLTHYEASCDFDWGWKFTINGKWASRQQEFLQENIHTIPNLVDDISVTVTKKVGR